MKYNPVLQITISTPSLAIILATICFLLYWFTVKSNAFNTIVLKNTKGESSSIRIIILQQFTGFFFMGIIPCIVIYFSEIKLSETGINMHNTLLSVFHAIPVIVLILIINFFQSRRESNLAAYPMMRVQKWNLKIVAINTTGWIFYLLAYEFLFRGVLFLLCYSVLGFWLAAIINVSIYSLSHIPKGTAETFGAFPFGLLLCHVTALTDSVLFAFIIHLTLALSNDYFSIFHHPTMQFQWKKISLIK